MPIIALSILVQIACAVHCVRNRGNSLWLMVIIFLSIPGCAAYAFFEILPQYAGHREVRRVRAAAAKALDPEREVRRAQEAVELSVTAANRIALGDALGDLGRWDEAIPQYEIAEAKAPAPERATRFKLARACFEAGRFEQARTLIETLPESGSQAENDRAALLHSRMLEQDGKTDQALTLYEELGRRMPGGEAQCRQAALLMAVGRGREAVPPLVEVERRMKRLDRIERANHADMYDWAARTLAELRR